MGKRLTPSVWMWTGRSVCRYRIEESKRPARQRVVRLVGSEMRRSPVNGCNDNAAMRMHRAAPNQTPANVRDDIQCLTLIAIRRPCPWLHSCRALAEIWLPGVLSVRVMR
jgi:hypothetical protein